MDNIGVYASLENVISLLERCSECCNGGYASFHCPLCPVLQYKPRQIHHVKQHLRVHWRTAVQGNNALCVYTPGMEKTIRSETVLAASYDAVSRPTATTTVKVAINIVSIGELDLKSQTMSAVGWLTVEWQDDRLSYDKTIRGDIESVFAKPDTIWKPELVIDNLVNEDELGVINDEKLLLRYDYQGKVEWEPFIFFHTSCEVDITYYPYDQQKCAIDVVSWGYTNTEITLEKLRTDVNLEDFEENGEWTVTKSEVQISSIKETKNGTVATFPQLKFWIFAQRRTYFYNLNVMMPIFLTSLLIALVFVVPVESGEKISYVLTVLLALAVILTVVADRLPPTSIYTSILGLYLGLVLVLAAVGVVLTVGIILIYHRAGHPKSSSIIMVITRFAARVTCYSSARQTPKTGKVAPSEVEVAGDIVTDLRSASQPMYPPMTWMDVSTILDRFCFMVFSIVTVIMNITFTVTGVAGGYINDPPSA